MQIIETELLRVIVPEEGYKLINKTNNKSFNKVYLGINDSPDNYIEVVDDEYVDIKYNIEINELKTKVDDNQECNDINLDMLLLSMAKIYEMVEPFLAMVPMTMSIDNEQDKPNPLINMYLNMVQRGLLSIDEVPEIFREDVKNLL